MQKEDRKRKLYLTSINFYVYQISFGRSLFEKNSLGFMFYHNETLIFLSISSLILLSLMLLYLIFQVTKTKNILKITLKNLEKSKKRFLDVTNAAQEVVWEIDKYGNFIYVSNRIEEILGYSPKELRSISVFELLEKKENIKREIKKSIIRKEKIYKRKYKFIHKKNYEVWIQSSGVPLFNEKKEFIGFRGVSSDVTIEYYREQKLFLLAQSDSLTGLMNRRYFMEKTKKLFERSLVEKKDFSFVIVDVDYFKKINDRFGHDAGDIVLKNLAKIMKGFLKQNYLLGRLGGEEFAFTLPHTNISEAEEYMTNIQKKVNSKSFNIKEHKIFVTISIGISYLNPENQTLEGIAKAADVALYEVKNSGRDMIKIQRK